MADKVDEAAVLKALRSVQDPDLDRDVVSLGFIKNVKVADGRVSFSLELTTPACPMREQMREQASRAVAALPGVTSVDIAMTSQVRPAAGFRREQLIPGVKNVIPVASGKGGVGKSTVAANLALALARDGASVGLMDADVYGPSIPTIMGVTETPERDGERVKPVTKHGVKVMSMGFFIRDDQAVIWRGPMLSQMVEVFLGGVAWGDLDYLIVDLPPGTGDVQLTLCQRIPITGAAIVSTPQDLALSVAQKAILMFKELNTPVLGVIENMSYYQCAHCGTRDDIFGHGGSRRAADQMGLPFLGEIPLASSIREDSDKGRPTIIAAPDSPLAKAYLAVAEKLAAQVSIRGAVGESKPEVQISF